MLDIDNDGVFSSSDLYAIIGLFDHPLLGADLRFLHQSLVHKAGSLSGQEFYIKPANKSPGDASVTEASSAIDYQASLSLQEFVREIARKSAASNSNRETFSAAKTASIPPAATALHADKTVNSREAKEKIQQFKILMRSGGRITEFFEEWVQIEKVCVFLQNHSDYSKPTWCVNSESNGPEQAD